MRPYLLLAVAISFLSLPAILVRWAQVPIDALGFWRTIISACALAPLAWSRRAGWLRLPKADRRVVFLAGALFFTHLWLFTDAARHTKVANCMLAFSVHPLFTALGARAFFGRRIRPRQWVSFLLGGLGLWTLLSGSASFGASHLRGDLGAVASAAAFSAYVLSSQHARANLDNWVFTSIMNATTAGVFLLVGLGRGEAFFGWPPSSWAALVALGLGVTLLGHGLFTHLFAELDVHLLSLAKLLEPPTAAVIAVFVFSEALTARTIVSFVLIASSIAVSIEPTRRSGSTPLA